MLPKIAMADATRKGLANKAQAAGTAAQTLETFDLKVHHDNMDALADQWGHAETHLREAYEQLQVEAGQDRDSSAKSANWARFAAWAFTALAALMMGDWKKLVSVREAAARTASEAEEPVDG
jgi:hypothetical protein